MKILITSSFHHKNQEALITMLEHMNIEYKFGNEIDIPNYDVIYSPVKSIDTSKYPSKKFIFGPHFSVFPDNKILQINNIHKNSIYIQPSPWASRVWTDTNVNNYIPVVTHPFPVNINRFKCMGKERTKVFIYYKRRDPNELLFLRNFLDERYVEYKIFDYIKRYDEEDYLYWLQKSKYGIILDAHESQGFAIEEALSCNVPLLVWNVKFMSQEYKSRYDDIPATTVDYFDERCGEIFYEQNELEAKFEEFTNKLDTYSPREYILENLSCEKCCERFLSII
jgi:hypothetical protein